jgi:hypothetical protein
MENPCCLVSCLHPFSPENSSTKLPSWVPGVQVIDAYDVAPGPLAEVYAFTRPTTQRNLYRVPVR